LITISVSISIMSLVPHSFLASFYKSCRKYTRPFRNTLSWKAISIYIYVWVYIYIYIYIYMHTPTQTYICFICRIIIVLLAGPSSIIPLVPYSGSCFATRYTARRGIKYSTGNAHFSESCHQKPRETDTVSQSVSTFGIFWGHQNWHLRIYEFLNS
jgi:hypothetical protein